MKLSKCMLRPCMLAVHLRGVELEDTLAVTCEFIASRTNGFTVRRCSFTPG